MSTKLRNKIEIVFLNQIYVHKGAIEVRKLLRILESDYSLKEDLFNKILETVTQKEYCTVEKIRKLDDTEEEVVFVTYKGLERLSKEKNLSVKKVLKKQIAYEIKCEGYATYSDWLDANRNQLALETEITRMFARVLADMEIILMCKDNESEIKETLQEAIERMNGKAKRVPELYDSVAYSIALAIYDKLLSLVGTGNLFNEVETARKLIKSYMPKRHAIAIDFI